MNESLKLDDPKNEEAVQRLINNANKYSSLKDKLAYINDEISLHAKYSKDVPEGLDIGYVLNDGKGVCTHFSMTLKYILDRLGVPCVTAASTGRNHMTNFVYIDGEWKVWDLTWNTCQGTSNEAVLGWYKGPDGKPVIIRGPANRMWFLLSWKERGLIDDYIQELGNWVSDFIASAEYGIALQYPELSRGIKIDPGDIEVNINEVKDYIAKNGGKAVYSNPVAQEQEEKQNTQVTPPVGPVKPEPVDVPEPVGNTHVGGIDDSMITGKSFSFDNTGKLITNNTTTVSKQTVVQAQPTSSSVIVNGKKVAFEAYNIDGYNYFKLRDIAMALKGTNKQFEVKYDGSKNAIVITTGAGYTPVGGELKVSGVKAAKKASPTPSKVYVNGKEVQFTAYNIDGYNYFKLRDIGKALNFSIVWDGENNAIKIDTSEDYKD